MDTVKEACSLDVLRTFRSCSHLLHHRKCPPMRGQGRMLVIIMDNDGITQRELLDLAKVRSASLSETLSRLENEGMISREKCEDDRRNIRVWLTEAGLAEAKAVRKRLHDDAVQLFSALTDEERRQLLGMLQRLQRSWEESLPQED